MLKKTKGYSKMDLKMDIHMYMCVSFGQANVCLDYRIKCWRQPKRKVIKSTYSTALLPHRGASFSEHKIAGDNFFFLSLRVKKKKKKSFKKVEKTAVSAAEHY